MSFSYISSSILWATDRNEIISILFGSKYLLWHISHSHALMRTQRLIRCYTSHMLHRIIFMPCCTTYITWPFSDLRKILCSWETGTSLHNQFRRNQLFYALIYFQRLSLNNVVTLALILFSFEGVGRHRSILKNLFRFVGRLVVSYVLFKNFLRVLFNIKSLVRAVTTHVFCSRTTTCTAQTPQLFKSILKVREIAQNYRGSK